MVDEIESEGCDDGRFFVHLKEGYFYTDYPDQRSKTFSSITEAYNLIKTLNRD